MRRLAALLLVPLLLTGAKSPQLGGLGAFADLDCAKINRDPRRSRLRVFLSDACAVTIPSPNGKLVARSRPAGDGDHIVIRVTGGLVVKGLEQPIAFLWNPASTGFLLNDGEGSGQTSKFRYFAHFAGGWRESRRLHVAAERFFLRRQHCRRGAYANVSGMEWTAGGEVRATVQEGVHSEGCLQPEDGNVALELIGEPWSGRIRLVRVRIDR